MRRPNPDSARDLFRGTLEKIFGSGSQPRAGNDPERSVGQRKADDYSQHDRVVGIEPTSPSSFKSSGASRKTVVDDRPSAIGPPACSRCCIEASSTRAKGGVLLEAPLRGRCVRTTFALDRPGVASRPIVCPMQSEGCTPERVTSRTGSPRRASGRQRSRCPPCTCLRSSSAWPS
jgi:hypothetical protein